MYQVSHRSSRERLLNSLQQIQIHALNNNLNLQDSPISIFAMHHLGINRMQLAKKFGMSTMFLQKGSTLVLGIVDHRGEYDAL